MANSFKILNSSLNNSYLVPRSPSLSAEGRKAKEMALNRDGQMNRSFNSENQHHNNNNSKITTDIFSNQVTIRRSWQGFGLIVDENRIVTSVSGIGQRAGVKLGDMVSKSQKEIDANLNEYLTLRIESRNCTVFNRVSRDNRNNGKFLGVDGQRSSFFLSKKISSGTLENNLSVLQFVSLDPVLGKYFAILHF